MDDKLESLRETYTLMKTLAFIRCYGLFFLGDFISKIPFFGWVPGLYTLYSRCMLRSMTINDRYKLNLWVKHENQDR